MNRNSMNIKKKIDMVTQNIPRKNVEMEYLIENRYSKAIVIVDKVSLVHVCSTEPSEFSRESSATSCKLIFAYI